jgi:hypothetical protein
MSAKRRAQPQAVTMVTTPPELEPETFGDPGPEQESAGGQGTNLPSPPLRVRDSGTATPPTPRTPVFGPGMPATARSVDYGGGTPTIARPDTRNPASNVFSNPPSAPADPGAA